MSQYIRFSFRLAQDIFNLGFNLGFKVAEYIQDTLSTWSNIPSKNYWNCQNCGNKYDLAESKQKEICTVCRIRRVLEN